MAALIVALAFLVLPCGSRCRPGLIVGRRMDTASHGSAGRAPWARSRTVAGVARAVEYRNTGRGHLLLGTRLENLRHHLGREQAAGGRGGAASRRHFGVELGSDLFKWVHPDDQHAGGKTITESLARGEDHVSFRYRLVLPDGSIRHVQAFARTYCDAAGKPQRSLGVSWDVTPEVEAAERAARDAAKERQLLERLSVRPRPPVCSHGNTTSNK